jgi:hypothetical protein
MAAAVSGVPCVAKLRVRCGGGEKGISVLSVLGGSSSKGFWVVSCCVYHVRVIFVSTVNSYLIIGADL